jgi:uncharacterized protein (TIGR02996 family)
MTTDERAFLDAIAANRFDCGLRKIFADWLDEHGRPEEADYQRRWTAGVGHAEDWLGRFAADAGLTYDEVVMAARRHWLTGKEYGTGMNFEPGNLLAFGESNKTPQYEFDGGAYLARFWECIGLLFGETVPEVRRAGEPFVCCEWDGGLDDEYFPYPAGHPERKADDEAAF